MSTTRLGTHHGTIAEHLEHPTPVLSLSHLPSRSNQSNESYHYSPFGTHILHDMTYPNHPSESWSVSFAAGWWDEDCWQQNRPYRPEPMAEGIALKDACRIILEDILRRYRETPPIVDPELAPTIDADADADLPRQMTGQYPTLIKGL